MIRGVARPAEWLYRYDRGDLYADSIGGLTIAFMLIPQGMAYAMLAGLPPVVGLYASVIPVIAYSLIGSSRHLAVGPVAMVSILVYTNCSPLAAPGSADYFEIVLLLTLMVGVIHATAGLIRAGSVVNFFSPVVISGFTSAAAVIIALSQLKHLLGVPLSGDHSIVRLLPDIIQKAGDAHIPTLWVGLAGLAGILVLNKWKPRFPSAVLLVVAGTIFVRLAPDLGIQTAGGLPRGLPPLTIPSLHLDALWSLLPGAFAIIFVGFMESVSVARYVATRSGYKIDPDRELAGLGIANITGAFSSGLPVAGGFSRTAVSYQAGVRTQLAAVMAAITVLLTLLFLTPLFYHLPNAILGAIIIAAVMGLIDVKEAARLFRIKTADGLTYLLTFIFTLTTGLSWGLLIGMLFSLGVFIRRSSHPHTAELGYSESENVFRSVDRYPDARRFDNTLILRPDASLYFANMKFLEERLAHDLSLRSPVTLVVMDMSGVNDIDAVAVNTLEELMEAYEQRGIAFAFTAMKGPVRDLVERAGWDRKFGHRYKYPSTRHLLIEAGLLGTRREAL
jgi:sulfate permease, SulP family